MFFTELFLIPIAVVLGVISLAIIFLPTIIAGIRKHRQFIPILILNIFLWWTFIAWAVALAWAFVKDNQDETVTIKMKPVEPCEPPPEDQIKSV
ncbi:MAG: superinfection immunity protein [Candidatus Omnitrophica bacterium]|nr:superinfection immunity protein [Candidatus Omnitrophota bacterium]